MLGSSGIARANRSARILVLGVVLASSPFAAAAPEVNVGTPEAGARGIMETVEQIAARDGSRFQEETSIAAEEPTPALPESAGTSFKAIGLSESGFIPPNTAGDVGATQILVATNGRVRVFAKTGAPGALNVTALSFWASVTNGSQPVFPQVRYDRLSGRWILLAVNSVKPNNRVMIAVQTTPGTITAASSFTFYQFDQTSGGGGNGDNSEVCDSPRLGIDNNALYIGCNMNSSSGSVDRFNVYVVRKASVIPAPGTLVVTAFRDLSNGTAGPGPSTPVGVDNDDPQSTSGYVIGVDVAATGLLQLRRISDPGGTPTLSGNLPLTVPPVAPPILQPASGSSVSLDAGDDRLGPASLHRNKLTGATTLWTSQSSEVDAACAAAAGGGRNGARWYEITGSAPSSADPLGGTPVLVQTGTLCDPSDSAPPKGYTFPSVAASGQGHMALGSTVAATNLFAGVAAAGRLRIDPAGATPSSTTVQNGLASYSFVSAGHNFWGDTSFTGVDPADDQTMWTFQEYADSPANNWAIRAIQLRAPPPPTLTGLQAAVCTGMASNVVTLTGTNDAPVGGAEFFDPGPDPGGPGYASHISATATGGLAVSGTPAVVLPADPATQPVLQVMLTLDTTAAPAGLKSVTIKNPDGQTTTGSGVIRVEAPIQPVAGNNSPLCEGGTLQFTATTVAGASYAWTGPNGFVASIQNPSLANAGLAAGGTYTVTLSGTGCTLPPAMTTAVIIAEGAACNDGDVCTSGDSCGAGSCQPGAPIVCDDGNPCTVDTCNPVSGCVFTDNSSACNDGNPCTDDSCDPATGCVHTDNAVACNDGNACTLGDTCGGGSCQPGVAAVCDDANVCTADSCDPATGCVYTDTSATDCDDANICTADSCDPGTGCAHQDVSAACNDGNPCTDDSCDPVLSCLHADNTGSCTDGDACTLGDLCGGGSCHPGTAAVCDDNSVCTTDSCDPATGCVFTDITATCDDGNACTADSCDPVTGCAHADISGGCDDHSVCTVDSCDPAVGCVFTDTSATDCNDGNFCTADSCDPIAGCQHVDDTAACNDGNACTSDSCDPGTGCVHVDTSASCDDGNACTTDYCNPFTGCVFDDDAFLRCNDQNPCTDDSCDPATGCAHANNTAGCEDGDFCTVQDTCADGVCQPGITFTCDDGNLCTTDGCDPRYGCVFVNDSATFCNDNNVCTADSCDPQTGCHHQDTSAACSDGNPCTDDSCDPATGCVHADNTAACDDGDPCTTSDACGGGICRPGAAISCDDANACTADSCEPSTGCVHADHSADCSDGNACTIDSCDPATGCVFTDGSAACDDGNPCTDDSCDPLTGCVHGANTVACDDGDACTTGDTCGAGSCQPGAPVACDDGNACTADSCSPLTGCVFTDNTAACNDGNVCTDDSCDPATGCAHAGNTAGCDDGDACTAGDTCVGGSCQPGAAVTCEDTNACTADGCDPATGCTHTDHSADCNDGNACTLDSCNPATGCVFADMSAACDDGNPCTDDSCDPALGCVHVDNTAACSDGDACTAGDTCGAGACQPGPALVCDDGSICTTDSCDPATGCAHAPASGACDDGNACTAGDTCGGGVCQPGAAISCDDSNPCTDDSCDPATGCVHADNAASCTDGNACTAGDTCVGGTCQPGAPTVCNDANACTVDSCNPATGCVFTDNSAACNDGNVCTTDSCSPATGCVHANNTLACSDGSACTTGDVCGGGTCHPGTATVCNDSDACTTDSCNPATGVCVFAAISCDDNNACTADTCQRQQGCRHTNLNGACSDGNACTTGDACAGGVCQPGSAVVCNDNSVCTSDSCNPATGCVFTDNTATLCNDGNGCTDDLCNATSGCFHANNTAPCSDGDACTAGDACGAGICHAGTAVVCDDGNPCTAETCNPATGCVFTNTPGPCSDGSACTTGDTCSDGTCQPGAAIDCNDNNPCTADSCDPASGCVHADTTAACDDGNACTSADTCNGGTCFGVPIQLAEVQGVAAQGGVTTSLTWTAVPDAASYDVITSTLSGLQAGGVAGAACLADDLPTAGFVDSQPTPAADDGYYYLIRAAGACGNGSYGYNSGSVERVPAAGCP